MNSQPLVIFDSGVGGFSILQELLNTDHKGSVIYLADQAGCPYGNKSELWIKNRLTKLANWAQAQNPAVFTLACNTATVSGAGHLRRILSCPVVAIEPVIKPLSNFNHPLLLATQTTINSPHTHSLIKKYQQNLITLCPNGLVQAVEDMNQKESSRILTSLAPVIKKNNVDAIGLSCTHYPLVKELIKELYPLLDLIDPSLAVVNRIHSLLKTPPEKELGISFFTTGSPTLLTNQVKYYLGIDSKAKGVKL